MRPAPDAAPGPAPIRPAAARPRPALLAVAVVMLLPLLLVALRAGAQTNPPAVQSDPPRDAVLAAAPPRIDLYFLNPTDPATPALIQVVDERGSLLPLGPTTTDPSDPRYVFADLPPGLGAGTYTVLWTARDAVDAATRTGTYAFRVDPPRAAGVASGVGTWPAWWGAASRWLVWLGLALALGAGLLGRLAGGTGPAPAGSGRLELATLGGVLALVAAVAQPLLTRIFPPPGTPGLTLGAAFRSMPPGWWLLLAAAALLALLGLGLLATGRAERPAVPAVDGGLVLLALAGAAGLALTSRADGPGGWNVPLLVADLLHGWSSLALAGGALALALLWRSPAATEARRVGGRAIGQGASLLAAVAVVSGVAGAGLVLPSVGTLTTSAWGWALIAKAVLAVLLLAVGWLALGAFRKGSAAAGAATAAAALAAVVLLSSSVLALTAAPATPRNLLAQVDFAGALPVAVPGLGATPGMVHVAIQPTRPGRNVVAVRLTDAEGGVPDGSTPLGLQVGFSPIDHDAEPTLLEPPVDPATGVALATVDLPGAGWWALDVVVTPKGGNGAPVTFYLALPDPNVTGGGPTPASDPAARAVFERGLASFATLGTVGFGQRLDDGGGSVFTADTVVSERPPAYRETSATTEVVIADGKQWVRSGNDPWQESIAASIPLPSTWADAYVRATGFRLGPVREIDGEPCQIVTFFQPSPSNAGWAAAWYVWWVGEQTGYVRREAMVSTRHYMVYDYRDFNAPVTITPPADLGTPVATPGP